MVSEAPPFWWEKADWRAATLSPLSFLYGQIAGYRMRTGPRRPVEAPVICIGNFTVGGAGKTPTALAIAKAAKTLGRRPGFLSRGYGGSLAGVTVVDLSRHRAIDVGDEPLLLAREALTVISSNRYQGALKLIEEGADLIIMDDGFQSARIVIDYALVVIDSGRGIGNGHLVPGGPVRAPLCVQISRASALLKVGTGMAADPLVRRAAKAGKPFFAASLRPSGADDLGGRNVLPFAGIADPAKFFRTVESLGAAIGLSRSFPDHHTFSEIDARDILNDAAAKGLLPVTTAKDFVRLRDSDAGHDKGAGISALAELAASVRVIDVDMVFDDLCAPALIIEAAIRASRQRLLTSTSKPRKA